MRVLDDFPLERIEPFIDWTPFFTAWELRGRFPQILDEPRAKELFDDGQRLLREIIDNRLLSARAVYGFWPANSVGDDIELYADESRSDVIAALPHAAPAAGDEHRPATSRSPISSRRRRAASSTTSAASPSPPASASTNVVARFEKDHDDYNAIMTKALADRLAEAFAEMLHKDARAGWGTAATRTSRATN